jgi:NADP-dependent 3-hydroxy acid dehydrogenase YdfG
VLITGGSQGLGEAMAIDFAKKGADIVLVSRSEEKLKHALLKVEVFFTLCLLNVGCTSISRSKVHFLLGEFDQCGGSKESDHFLRTGT